MPFNAEMRLSDSFGRVQRIPMTMTTKEEAPLLQAMLQSGTRLPDLIIADPVEDAKGPGGVIGLLKAAGFALPDAVVTAQPASRSTQNMRR